MPYKAKFGHLLIVPDENDHNTTAIYIADPTPLEEKNFGTVFSIVDIESKDPKNEQIIATLNEELVQNYYRSCDLEVEMAFENTLHLVNRKMQEIVSEVGEDWLKKFNIAIGVIKNQELHFTSIGNIFILLTQNNQIIKLNDSRSTITNPLKIFSNILSGKLTANDSVIFCTETILDYLSQEKIKKILIENDPTEAVRYIENVLQENSNAANFGSLIIKLLHDEVKVAEPMTVDSINHEKLVQETDSMHNLVSQQSKTEELLSPSLWPSLKKNLKKWKQNVTPDNISSSADSKGIEKTMAPNIAITILKKIGLLLKKLGEYLMTAIIWIVKNISKLFQRDDGSPTRFNGHSQAGRGILARIINWFKGLSTPRKAFFILLIVIVALFLESVLWQGKKQDNKVEKDKIQAVITEANNKLGEADSKLIMNDYTGARTLVTAVAELLKTVPADQVTDQTNKIRDIEDKVNLVNRITDPQLVANFASAGDNVSVFKIALISKNIFAFNQNNASVYNYNLETNEGGTVISSTDDNKIIAADKDSVGTVLLSFEDQSFQQFNPVLEKLSDVTVELPTEDTAINDFNVFGTSRLYVLDPKNNQVYKVSKTDDNYTGGKNWMTDSDIDLRNAVSMAVESAIFVLNDSGEIIRLYGGTQDKTWVADELSPNLERATKIFTDENVNNLYVLDPANRRLVVLDKNGKLTAQYTSDKWSDLKDMVIDETNKTAYLLSGAEVFQVELK